MADKYNYFCSAGKRIEAKWLRLACGHSERELVSKPLFKLESLLG